MSNDSPSTSTVKPLATEIQAGLVEDALLDERVVALRPALVRALDGDVALAALVQQLHWRESTDRGVEKWDSGDGLGWWVDASRAEIAADLGISEPQARRLVEKAREKGLIETQQPFAAGHDRRLFARICRIERPESAEPGDGIVQDAGTESSLLPIEGFREVPKEETPRASDSFEAFWLAYPRRNGYEKGSKKKARAIWDRLNPADRARAMLAVPNYAAGQDARWVKDAFRWLQDELWVDWAAPRSGRPGGSFAGPGGKAPEHPPTREEREAW